VRRAGFNGARVSVTDLDLTRLSKVVSSWAKTPGHHIGCVRRTLEGVFGC
jgi:hypothetical protein